MVNFKDIPFSKRRLAPKGRNELLNETSLIGFFNLCLFCSMSKNFTIFLKIEV